MSLYRAGIDIGSTTVKLVIIDDKNEIVFGKYERHLSHTQKTLGKLLLEAKTLLGSCNLDIKITGSGGIGLGKALNIPFVQEVVGTSNAILKVAPKTDVAIELGGEDAKIIYFGNSIEERMNGVCAGGTGSFIDQMATLLQTDAKGLNELAKNYQEIYPIAARCGVFAKSDIQPLINDGATKEDLAASIFQAVVNQTISGLACGKPIRGVVCFLGGPLHFLSELKKAFIRTLKLTDDYIVDPSNSHLFAALGAALNEESHKEISIDTLLGLVNGGVQIEMEIKRLDPLFKDEKEYASFVKRHEKAIVLKEDLKTYEGLAFLGIDAGSTTTKIALVSNEGKLLYSNYQNNEGSPLETCKKALLELKTLMNPKTKIARACSTGYGEELLKNAFNLDEGEVETVAHSKAASFFDPLVDCVLDIGGQDMKCIHLKKGFVDKVVLNEACSSGCGSFLENFAKSLGLSVEEFANAALYAKNPVDLGTRCTVFMNSNVKQAQKEGAKLSDISAGLAYSVIKNALYKVIKLTNIEDLGQHIVVQGGTFYNHAVLRALEKITGVSVVCPDISGIMGAFGAALIAKERYTGNPSSFSLDAVKDFTYKTTTTHCKGCINNCMLTINTFNDHRRFISGNRCEKGGGVRLKNKKGVNLVEYKRKRIFQRENEELDPSIPYRGEIGIPRVLNIYENFPFWATFFHNLGFKVVLSPESTHKIYEMGIETIPSESECYPAKLSHGHVEWLIKEGVKTIFHPCVFYEHQETKDAQNHFNCPIVVSYPENLNNNIDDLKINKVKYLHPFISFASLDTVTKRMVDFCKETWNLKASEVKKACKLAWDEQLKAKEDIRTKGEETLIAMEAQHKKGIVLAGRPYHIDKEINHGIPELIASYGFDVFTEDSLPLDFNPTRPIRVVDQWVFHSRLYNAAEFVSYHDDLELVQLNSFGCGLDAVTTDQVSEILEKHNKLYTVLKIDEVSNLGAIRIRIRSLIAAIRMRGNKKLETIKTPIPFKRVTYTKKMQEEGYTLLVPRMSPIHFDLCEPIFKHYGYNVEVLRNDNKNAIDMGLKYVNNDACYPSILTVGQIMDAVMSGKYDTHKLAIIMSQTGGCCRASNYVAFIRRALEKAHLEYIPVVSVNLNGMETNPGFKPPLECLFKVLKGGICGDLLMRCLYRVRPYEKIKGSSDSLVKRWQVLVSDSLTGKNNLSFKECCEGIVKSFDELEINENIVKPKVGIVGEILVKYMPLANNNLVNLLESEGAEVVVPDLIDFLNYSLYNQKFKHENYHTNSFTYLGSKIGIKMVLKIRKPAIDALKKSKRFEAPLEISEIAKMTEPFLSIGNQYGEGWFLTGEMVELITHGTKNIVCIQPFGCLPNHVVGKGVIKVLKETYEDANICAVDYDPGASEVNQLNRIKLMLSEAKRKLERK